MEPTVSLFDFQEVEGGMINLKVVKSREGLLSQLVDLTLFPEDLMAISVGINRYFTELQEEEKI
jgi:hypothetical protein